MPISKNNSKGVKVNIPKPQPPKTALAVTVPKSGGKNSKKRQFTPKPHLMQRPFEGLADMLAANGS